MAGSVLFFSCKKKSDGKSTVDPPKVNKPLASGYPDDNRAINGYFYASLKAFSNSYFALNCYVIVNDPAGDLINTYDHFSDFNIFGSSAAQGNISLGSIYFGSTQLLAQNGGNRITYRLNGSQSFTNSAVPVSWKTDGNGTFSAVNTTVPRGFPGVVNSPSSSSTYTLSKSNGLVLDVADIASNFDSLIVAISVSSSTVKRKVTAGASTIVFSSNELSGFSANYTGYMYVYAYNYSNMTVEDKVYLFELSTKLQKNVVIYP